MRHGARNRRRPGWWQIVPSCALVLSGAAMVGGYARAHDDVALPGTTVAGQDVSGLDRDQIVGLVSNRFNEAQVTIRVGGSSQTATLAQAGVVLDADATARAAVAGAGSFGPTLRSIIGPREVIPAVTLDEDAFAGFLASAQALAGTAPVPARIQLSADGTAFEVVPDSSGTGVDGAAIRASLTTSARSLSGGDITVAAAPQEAPTTTSHAKTAVTEANALISGAVILTGAGSSWTATTAEKASWVTTTATDEGMTARIDPAKVRAWVDARAAEVDKAPVPQITNVDAAGNDLGLARPGRPGTRTTNAQQITDGIVSSLRSGTDYSGALASEPVAPSARTRAVPSGPERFAYQAADGEKWVDVNLTDDTMTAYVGTTVVHGPVNINHGEESGEWATKLGTHHVYLKNESQDLGCAPDFPYCQKAVPWIAYWDGNFAIHGAPWATDFGYDSGQVSHGCVNAPVEEARWFYDFVEIGTTVVTHE
ncbi:L,D-transpeptidase family protein [Actinomyces marmotae]|uniref:L,D-transpeptidase n=1 Tax=Actinomyces marmotae TaxID=2737173 RepID=A0A6M8B5Z9_9ACTO|nr:L,D-transpeptidase [Actinomyces marmotae]QKD80077.1 L,D-transpeptidase [Actinomyces marmotae]